MHMHVLRIDDTLPLPEYQTKGAIAFDLYVRETTTIPAKGYGLIPNNLIVQVPEGYGLFVCARSSTMKRFGLIPPHGLGVIDRDYCGPEDELKTLLYNTTDHDVTVPRGERISQALLLAVPTVEIIEGFSITEESRGGFGSTSR